LIVPLWIEAADAETLTLCRIMLLWLWFNALIVPAWFYLIAAGAERYLAGAVALHSLLSLAAFVLGLPPAAFLALWAGAGVFIYAIAAAAATGHVAAITRAHPHARFVWFVLASMAAGLLVAILQQDGWMESAEIILGVLIGFLLVALLFALKSLSMLRSLSH
jgi:hypothetical protein